MRQDALIPEKDPGPFKRLVEKLLYRDLCDARDNLLPMVPSSLRLHVREKLHQLVQITIKRCWEAALLGPGSLRISLPTHENTTSFDRFLTSTGGYLKDVCQLRYREEVLERKGDLTELQDVCLYAPLLHFPAEEQEVMRLIIEERVRSLQRKPVVIKEAVEREEEMVVDDEKTFLKLGKELAESRLKDAEDFSAQLQEMIESMKVELSSMDEASVADKKCLQKEIEDLTALLAKETDALQEEKRRSEEMKIMMQSQLEELQKASEEPVAVVEDTTRIDELQSELDALQAELENVRSEKEQTERELGAQINQLRRDSGDGNAMNATLLQERDDRIAALERELEELRATIAESATKAGEDHAWIACKCWGVNTSFVFKNLC